MSGILAKRALAAHPDSPSHAAIAIEAAILVRPDAVWLARYVVTGDIAALRLPALAAADRTDGLWRTTCFELFSRAPGEDGYQEFNFAPSGQWAAYGFTGYREAMAPLPVARDIAMTRSRDAAAFVLTVELDRALAGRRIGLSAVIEEADGTRSFWALAHPPGKPDFHHRDCFALELPPAG